MKLFETWKEVMFNPLNFYEKLQKKIGFKEPSLFFLKVQAIVLGTIYVLGLIVLAFFALIFTLISEAAGSPLFGAISGSVIGIAVLIALLLYPILLLLSWGILFVSAGITHLFVLIFGGKQGYVETFKATAYSMAPQVFCIIPLVNWAAMIYIFVLQVIGIKHRQKLSWGKSVAAVLLPLVLFLALFVIGYLIFIFSFLATGAATAGGLQ